jgi:hypothetical protein
MAERLRWEPDGTKGKRLTDGARYYAYVGCTSRGQWWWCFPHGRSQTNAESELAAQEAASHAVRAAELRGKAPSHA